MVLQTDGGLTWHDLRSAFEHAPIGMAVADLDGTLSGCNEALGRLLGRDAAALPGTTLFAVTHPDDLAGALASCQRLAGLDEGVVQHECRLVHTDGRPLWVLVSTSRVPARDGRAAHLIMHVEDIQARKALEADLVHRALHDHLTGLPNRALLLDRTDHALAAAVRGAGSTSLLYLDLDGFKGVNDTLGHDAGDELLCQFADRLLATVRPGDTVARLGGDEFAVLCPGAGPAVAREVGERLREATSVPFDLARGEVRLRASVGCSTTDGSDPAVLAAARLLQAADAQMYAAKRRRGPVTGP